MKIRQISSGKIKIKDKEYSETVVVSSEGIIFSWKEKEKITEDDIDSFLKKDPDILIISISGKLKEVPFHLQQYLAKKGVILIVDNLSEAINSFNKSIGKDKNILGVFPLF